MDNRRDQERIDDELSHKLEKVFADPLRAWILAQLNDAPASASDLARKSKEPLNKIAYHVGKLEEWECIEHIDTIGVRGTPKKIYRGLTKVIIDLPTWEKMGVGPRTGISLKIFGETFERVQRAIEGGTFDARIDRVAANYKPRLDDEGWKKAVEIMHRANDEIEALEPEAMERHPDYADRKQITLCLYCFESPPPGAATLRPVDK